MSSSMSNPEVLILDNRTRFACYVTCVTISKVTSVVVGLQYITVLEKRIKIENRILPVIELP